MKIIEINGLAKSFGNKKVLNNVNISIEKGEILGLLGPSGAGKTTLIKILTGQIKAEGGNAKVLGANCDKLPSAVYSNIGVVMDNSGLYGRLNCYDNLKLFAKIFNVDKSYINEVLEKVELMDAKKIPADKLSKGMKGRLILARAILHKPELLFLDEPTSGLDPATTERIHELIFELKENGTTILLTTHDMYEATKLCDNVALLNEGKIIEYGEPLSICRKYNFDNSINILLNDGMKVTLKNTSDSSDAIKEYFENNRVISIHSSEPNLESVFISLTGRSLV
ncbi:MAG TPA: ABC transporter ATP-binding protein [Clostridiales bacterium]|nr:ABC transporter ATP-binding protein [Clostridiales bacterium]